MREGDETRVIELAEKLPEIRPLDASLYESSFKFLDEFAISEISNTIKEQAAKARENV